MYYIIYKTTNLINGKYYVGKHQTNNLEDGYQGSGNLIRRAFKKYGIENFSTVILEVYDAEWKMNLAEKILVVCDKEVSYNLCSGGKGGFGYINENNLNGGKFDTNKAKMAFSSKKNFNHSIETKIKIGSYHKDKNVSEETRIKISLSKKGISNLSRKGKSPWNKGILRSEETKRKISETLKSRFKSNG